MIDCLLDRLMMTKVFSQRITTRSVATHGPVPYHSLAIIFFSPHRCLVNFKSSPQPDLFLPHIYIYIGMRQAGGSGRLGKQGRVGWAGRLGRLGRQGRVGWVGWVGRQAG